MKSLVKEGTLGAILFKSQIITEKDIETALEEQKKSGLRFGEVLVSLGIVMQEDIDWALSHQLDIPYVRIKKETVDPAAVGLVPASIARKFQLFPLIRTGDELRVAIADPLNTEAVSELERLTGCAVSISMGLLREILEMQDHFYGKPEQPEQIDTASFSSSFFSPAVVEAINSDNSGAKFLKHILLYMRDKGLSSLSLKPLRDIVVVSGRQRGNSLTVGTLSFEHYGMFLSALRAKVRFKPGEGVSAQGSLRFSEGEEDSLFQVILMKTGEWEYTTFKPLADSPFPESMDGLEMPEASRQALRKLAAMAGGIVFFSAADEYERLRFMGACIREGIRSGKEAVMLGREFSFCNARNLVVPVERHDKDLGGWIRAVCEHDPDFVAVEEISDVQDLAAAFDCALKGKTFFSGLPSPDIRTALRHICRIRDAYPALTLFLKGLAACRGVRILCPACRAESAPPAKGVPFLDNRVPPVFFKAAGCHACRNTGYTEKRYLVEAAVADEEMLEALGRSARGDEVMAYLLQKGFKGIKEQAADLLGRGEITAEEFVSVSVSDGERPWQG